MSTLQANLKPMTDKEFEVLTDRLYDLEMAGKKDEAEELKKQVPLNAGMANLLKEDMGIKALIASGLNLSEAVEKYGKEWLNS